jgi:uncharacterized protein YyaL (SSP411 family)
VSLHRYLAILSATGAAALLVACGPPKAAAPQAQTPTPVSTNLPPAPPAGPAHAHTNRLAGEKSPYLRQHMHNPVDWYPWGEAAFQKARTEGKPIFLSIGYSTCHWCHVMERESFESEAVGKYLNEHFVSIKVDREERPDVDKIYMTAVQAMTGSGGWPLNLFITPDLKPFYGGTYFAPDDRYGKPGFLDLLNRIVELWGTRRSDITATAQQLHQQLTNLSSQARLPEGALDPGVLTNAFAQFKDDYDPRYGGFGGAPKFPRPTQPSFVLRQGVRHKDDEAIKMVLHTCERMAAGGMYDQLGGGFARYSVDAQWLVPHFEKMLYDNAQLIHLYLDAYLVSGESRHADVARDIIRYLLRDMTHPDGGFFSAEDADSEGQEGKFYCWTRAELSKLLTVEEFNVAVKYFGITEKGNFEDHSHPNPLPNLNVLSIVDPKLPGGDAALLEAAKKKMFAERVKRVRPHLDDKVLASWNGLMLGAVARAYAVLGDDAYRAAAEKNHAFIQAKLWDAKTKTLYSRWRDGERDNVQLLDAYAFQLSGTLELYQATLEPKHLEFAIAVAETMLAKFHDAKAGGFYQSTADAPDLIMRVKEDYDGAEPSGNSVATLALLKLAAITDRADYKQAGTQALKLFTKRLHDLPRAVPYLLAALDFSLEEPRRVVIAGDVNTPQARALLRAAHAVYQPNKVVLGTAGPVEEFAKTMPSRNGPTVYLCTGTACQPPTQDGAKVKAMLTQM